MIFFRSFIMSMSTKASHGWTNDVCRFCNKAFYEYLGDRQRKNFSLMCLYTITFLASFPLHPVNTNTIPERRGKRHKRVQRSKWRPNSQNAQFSFLLSTQVIINPVTLSGRLADQMADYLSAWFRLFVNSWLTYWAERVTHFLANWSIDWRNSWEGDSAAE